MDLIERAAELAWRLPAELAPLARIALDYRWSWDPDGAELFRALDPHAWELHARNPVRQLADLTPHLAEIAASHGPTLERIALAVQEVVERQASCGIDIVNDGEMSKPSYATYVQDRLTGFAGESIQDYFFADLVDYPRSADLVAANPGRRKRSAPACTAACRAA